MTHADLLDSLAAHLERARGGDAAGLAPAFRAACAGALAAALSPRQLEALEDVLTRLESASLFAGESCSFSLRDLHDALGNWLQHARRQLNRGAIAA